MIAGLDPRYERRIRLALRGFPKRFRAERTEEILGTLADANAGRSGSSDLETMYDLVRAGWAERWRTHPPLVRWLWYRLGGKLPPAYRGWLLDDLSGLIWLRSLSSLVAVQILATLAASWWFGEASFPFLLGTMVGGLLSSPLYWSRRRKWRRETLRRHGLDELGIPRPPAPGLTVRRVQYSYRAAPLFLSWGIALLVAFPIGVVAFLDWDRFPTSIASGGWLVTRDSTDHLWGIGVAALVLAALLFLVSLAAIPRLWWRMEAVAGAGSGRTDPIESTGAAPLLGVIAIVSLTFAGVMTLMILLLPAVVLAASGLGPCLVILGVAALRRERRTGSAVPMPFVRHRTVAQYANPNPRATLRRAFDPPDATLH